MAARRQSIKQNSGSEWPAYNVERRATSALIPYARNSRVHSPEQVAQIARSIQEFGWTFAVLVDEADGIIAGHARVAAAAELGLSEVPVIVARGWTAAQKQAYVIADNQLPLNATWDQAVLKMELKQLAELKFDMPLLGFDDVQLTSFISGMGSDEPITDDADRGALLELINVTIDDPEHVVERGDHYVLSKRHHLLCESVIDGWGAWQRLLVGNALFCPYPGVFVPFSTKAKTSTLVMVQPDAYIAGHILDRYSEVHGKKAIRKVEDTAKAA